MRYEGSALNVVDLRSFQQLSVIGSWRRRWIHWNGRGAADSQSVGTMCMKFIRCKEATYEPKINEIVERLSAGTLSADFTPYFDLICRDHPSSSHWSLSGQNNLLCDLDFESRFRCDEGIGKVMLG